MAKRPAQTTQVRLVDVVRQKVQQIATLWAELRESRELINTIDAEGIEALIGQPAKRPAIKAPVERMPRRRRGRKRGSSVTWAAQILADAGELHVDEIVKRIKTEFHRDVSKQSLVSSLARMSKRNDTFYRANEKPNTFGVIQKEGKRVELKHA